jgi:hypothetical protein
MILAAKYFEFAVKNTLSPYAQTYFSEILKVFLK